jgi:hypothetical protein
MSSIGCWSFVLGFAFVLQGKGSASTAGLDQDMATVADPGLKAFKTGDGFEASLLCSPALSVTFAIASMFVLTFRRRVRTILVVV